MVMLIWLCRRIAWATLGCTFKKASRVPQVCRARRTVIRRDACALDEPIEGAREAHWVDHAPVLRGEDQVLIRLLGPVLTGDLLFQGLQLAPLLQDARAELGKREHGL
jgi:hypothetical protein